MADGSLEIYDANDGFTRYNLHSRFLNILGYIDTPANTATTGEVVDSRITLGEFWHICVRAGTGKPESQYSGHNISAWNLVSEPTVTVDGDKITWTSHVRTDYDYNLGTGFRIYYGVF